MSKWFLCCAADEEDMDNSEEEESDKWMVTIGGKKIHYGDVKPEMVERLTPAEKEEYIHVGKLMYQDMYDD